MKKITTKNVSDHVDHLINVTESIELNKITILTGSNGSGKSFLRKLLQSKLNEKEAGIKVASTSMERRSSINNMEAMNAFIRDVDWNPTSVETYHQIEGLMGQKDRYLVIDEPELGMSEETILGLIHVLNEKLRNLVNEKTIKGVLIITHSRDFALFLDHDVFINMDDPDMTAKGWANRIIKPFHIKDLSEKSTLIFREIQNRINENKKQK